MGRHGPPAPDPDWERLDQRGPLSTRWAWGWLSPDGGIVVSDGGDVYVRVDREGITKTGRGSLSLGVTGRLVSALRRARSAGCCFAAIQLAPARTPNRGCVSYAGSRGVPERARDEG